VVVSQFIKSAPATLGVTAAVSLVLCSCASRRYSPLEHNATPAPMVMAPEQPAPEVIVLPNEQAPVIGLDNIDAGPLFVPTNVPPVPAATAPSITFGRGWIPMSSWTSRCALGKGDRVIQGNATTYHIPTRTGPCVLTIGSRLAHWNGTAVWLGFAPRIVRGEPHIHAVDAEKTLLPLSESQHAIPTPVRTVVLDPGHGGSDSGTRGARNQLEKEFTLDWALRTERLLTNAGWKVFLTRRSDVEVALAERVAFADRVRADLFLSLHFNSAFPQTQPSGIETYCVTPVGAPSTLLRGYADDGQTSFPNNAFDSANLKWAFRLHQTLLKETRAHDDGVKRARFMSVLRYQNRPAVLIEGGFLSNPGDVALIMSPAYRERLAQGILQALQ
jgi:N-acetylmuramoyl-L-alanine amidase